MSELRGDIWMDTAGPADQAQSSRRDTTKPPVTDIHVWLECYAWMAALLVTRFPQKGPDVNLRAINRWSFNICQPVVVAISTCGGCVLPMVVVSFKPLGVVPSPVTAGNLTHWWLCLASGGCEFDPFVVVFSLWWLVQLSGGYVHPIVAVNLTHVQPVEAGSLTRWWSCPVRGGCKFDSLVVMSSLW